MHYSGILITSDPRHLAQCVDDLDRIDGVTVFHRDPDRGRMVVVQETQSLRAQEEGFRRMRCLPHVLSLELVYHFCDRGSPESGTGDPSESPRKALQP